MSHKIVALLTVIAMTMLQACVVKIPQFEAAVDQFRKFSEFGEEARQPVWLASFNGHGAVLVPYVVEGYTVFANDSGDAVAFDGWVIRSVLGFGLDAPLTVSDDSWVRSVESGLAGFTATCSNWQREGLREGYEWNQSCGINGHETTIRIDETGSITHIKQVFGGGLGMVMLYPRH